MVRGYTRRVVVAEPAPRKQPAEYEELLKELEAAGSTIEDPVVKNVYLSKLSQASKQQRDMKFEMEFRQWLEGRHQANLVENSVYRNGFGKPVRRHMIRKEGQPPPGTPYTGWRHTPWGRATLTHLPGVREYLRDPIEQDAEDEKRLNLLAEFGPQNLEDARLYFKHWVKGEPIGPKPLFAMPKPAANEIAPGARSDAFDGLPGLLRRPQAYDQTDELLTGVEGAQVPSTRNPTIDSGSILERHTRLLESADRLGASMEASAIRSQVSNEQEQLTQQVQFALAEADKAIAQASSQDLVRNETAYREGFDSNNNPMAELDD